MTTTPTPTLKNTTAIYARRDGQRETGNGKPPPSSADLSGRTSDSSTVGAAEGEVSAKAPALPLDLAALPDDVLDLLADEAPREQQRRQAKREADYYEQVKEGARLLNIPLARVAARLAVRSARPSMLRPASTELGAGGEEDGRRHVKPKYRNPKNASETWSGRGAPPQWMADHLAAGGKKEDLAIPKDPE